VSNSC